MTASCAFVFTVLLILYIEALWAEAILLVQLRVLFILPAGKHHADALIERKVLVVKDLDVLDDQLAALVQRTYPSGRARSPGN